MSALSPAGLLAICLGFGLLTGLTGFSITRSPTITACFAMFALAAPLFLVRHRARKRRSSLRELWPEAVDHLASGIRAGLSLPEALGNLAERGPEGLREDFAFSATEYRVTGNFILSIDALKFRMADPVADRIVEALRITREVGGSDLGRMLRTLSAFLREDARTRSELEARQSWTINGARLAVAAPWIVLGLISTRPEAAVAYNTKGGALLLGIGIVASFLAYRTMRRLGRLPDEPRVLR
ncbi:type II secretion system F family protein [Saxibacter everestensis]|uniref:type II secretion system F family protein n=1 Tax=Saxibacter everestensis TaxID=2909229 RepID=UPI0032E363ED